MKFKKNSIKSYLKKGKKQAIREIFAAGVGQGDKNQFAHSVYLLFQNKLKTRLRSANL